MFQDLTGQIINNWKVIGFSHFDKHHTSHWICECQCKNKTIKTMNIQTGKDLAPQRHLFEQYGIVLQNDCEEAV